MSRKRAPNVEFRRCVRACSHMICATLVSKLTGTLRFIRGICDVVRLCHLILAIACKAAGLEAGRADCTTSPLLIMAEVSPGSAASAASFLSSGHENISSRHLPAVKHELSQKSMLAVHKSTLSWVTGWHALEFGRNQHDRGCLGCMSGPAVDIRHTALCGTENFKSSRP